MSAIESAHAERTRCIGSAVLAGTLAALTGAVVVAAVIVLNAVF